MKIFQSIRYFHTLGERMMKRLLSTIRKMDPERARLDMLRFSSAGKKVRKTAYSISRWTRAAFRNVSYADNPMQKWVHMPFI